jgi:signal transduction histidine kinase
MCRKLLAQHGGTIACESKEGMGTNFTVTLPCVQEAGDDYAVSRSVAAPV